MTDPMTRMLELRMTVLHDVDDEGRVLVTNDDSGSMQLSEVLPDGSWRRLTDLGEPVTGRYLPGSPRRAIVSVNPSGTERTQLRLLDLTSDEPTPPLQSIVEDPDHIYTLLDVGDDTIVYSTNRRDNVEFDIIRRTVSTGDEAVLYDGGGSFNEVAISADGASVVASRDTLIAASSQLLLIKPATGEVEDVTSADEPGEWTHPTWLPSGELVASSDNDFDRVEIRRWDPATRTWTTILGGDADADLFGIVTADGTRRAVIRSADGADTVEIHDENGAMHGVDLPSRGVITMYNPVRWSPSGSTLGFTFSAPDQPMEAYSWSAKSGTVRRTTSNDPASLPRLAEPRVTRIDSRDHEQLPVTIIRAADGKPSGSAVLHVHGGPESEARLTWNPFIAALALDGHTVVVPNVRGSSGYGRRWVGMDDIEKRLDSVADLADIHRWLPTIGIDADRVAVMGGSYGGYMTLAALTFHPDLWAAGVDIVGMSSLTTFMENTSAYRRAYRAREYGSLERHRDVLEAASPLPIIDRLRAPLLVIHGRNDPRVPLGEAEQVAAAVRANGAECELLIYDDEGHGLMKRKNRLDAYPKVAAFLRRHLASS